jgi:thiol-disulfide isomerase/thioredoxin
MKPRALILLLVLLAIGGTILLLESQKPARLAPQDGAAVPAAGIAPGPGGAADPRAAIKAEKAGQFERAKELTGIAGYINSGPFTIGQSIGEKVILVDFWTYSCINCQRTLPYLAAWHEKYKDEGLLIIGVHTPEFEFEKKRENVLAAARKFGVTYPVAQDNDYGTWQAYGNRYWPRKYLIDIDGFIVYDHIGEGAYAETERVIQELLAERMAALNLTMAMPKDIVKPIALPPPSFPVSPETYFGAARNSLLGNGIRFQAGPQRFSEPAKLQLGTLYLVGDWTLDAEFAESTAAGSRVLYQYDAKDVYLVAEAAEGRSEGVRIRIRRDREDTGDWAGADVVQEGGRSYAIIKEGVLYKLVQDKGGYGTHLLEIIAEEPGFRAFTFTFG